MFTIEQMERILATAERDAALEIPTDPVLRGAWLAQLVRHTAAMDEIEEAQYSSRDVAFFVACNAHRFDALAERFEAILVAMGKGPPTA